jgi:hypothetical protein
MRFPGVLTTTLLFVTITMSLQGEGVILVTRSRLVAATAALLIVMIAGFSRRGRHRGRGERRHHTG